MKREHITLPALQVAAAMFLITACQASTPRVNPNHDKNGAVGGGSTGAGHAVGGFGGGRGGSSGHGG